MKWLPENRRNAESLLQCLSEIGCEESQCARIRTLIDKGDLKTARFFLRKYRKTLMDDLHSCQDRVDCLDFLVYQLDKALKDTVE